tara:strand:+ start:716 stop:979 length:264 start_codon:yes stop_codon:yes gene_type:complete
MYNVVYRIDGDAIMKKSFKELKQAVKFAQYKIWTRTFEEIINMDTLEVYKGNRNYDLNIWYNEESAKTADMLANSPKGTGKKGDLNV